jgi:hypothetical protein
MADAMRKSCLLSLLAAVLVAPLPAADWIRIFDGKTLKGWKAGDRPEAWTAEDGAIVGRGERSHLFYMERECADCEFKAEVRLNNGGNSGMYFRAQFGPGWPAGYEAQVNNTHRDPKRTGSLYNFVNVPEQLIADDTWWTQHIIVNGNRVVIKVNDKTVVDYVDEKNTHQRGYVALQQHHQGSEVRYRNIMMKPLN